MARKRLILVEKKSEEPVLEELPEKYRDTGWKDWFRGGYARAWFIVLALFLDVIVVLEVLGLIEGGLGVALSLICLFFLVLGEMYLCYIWWGDLGFLFGGGRFL